MDAKLLDLYPAAVGHQPCIPTRELREGDVLYASGFPVGRCRRVLEVRIEQGAAFIRAADGWFRWNRVYCHVDQF
jgi:hypothetical protein